MCLVCEQEELHRANIETLKTIFQLTNPFNAEKVKPPYKELQAQLIDAKANANIQQSRIVNLISDIKSSENKVVKLTLLNRLQEQNLEFANDKIDELTNDDLTPSPFEKLLLEHNQLNARVERLESVVQ